MNILVQTHGLAHGRLDGQGLDVLPVLLQQRDQEIDRHLDVNVQFLLGQVDVTDGNTEAKNLLKLVLDGRSDLINLVLERVIMGNEGRELTGLVKTRSQKTRDHLDDRVGSKESGIPLGELLDKLLVLVKLLEVVNSHGINANGSGFFAMLNISKNTDLHLRTGAERKLDGSTETLIFLGIVVLQTDLEFDGFGEVTFLGGGTL